MEKIDLGHIKETIRIRNGVTQKIRLFNKKQQSMIINEIQNRPDDYRLMDMLKLYEISPAVFHDWMRKRKKNNINVPQPISEVGKNKWRIEIVTDNEERAACYLKMIQECFEISAKHNLPMTSAYMCDPERNEKLTCVKL